ncbi:acyl carrier protein [Protofrankia symbiont of Coriaria ruscifolia]|uniref:acyl carrier protein n=1 Tax=Protofrankia symbiont of Coriaria ruscifolia TaxID=1306542 RepID=UPI00104193B0|nr:acyl carrier protein [Protofrankia symbiont of Coriaria ruscifolia]
MTDTHAIGQQVDAPGPPPAPLTRIRLVDVLRESAGDVEDVDLDGDILDVPFTDLGYDSIALLEVSGHIERDYGISLGDDAVQEATTIRAFLDLVNAQLRHQAV